MQKLMLAALALGATIASPASAKDFNGYTAIAAGDFATAERTLVEQRQSYPDRPELMLNLAWVYRQTGRVAESRAMYEAVIARRDVAMDLPNGVVASSHALARAGLARTIDPQLSAR